MLMKAANINAIRTSHYPYGLEVFMTCAMSSRCTSPMRWPPAGSTRHCLLSDSPPISWRSMPRDELVRRDKNHPCVIIWAVGNENKPGPDNKVSVDEIGKLDTTRPRLVSWRNGDTYGTELDDLHYTPPAKIAELNAMTERRKTYPMIFLENPNMPLGCAQRAPTSACGWPCKHVISTAAGRKSGRMITCPAHSRAGMAVDHRRGQVSAQALRLLPRHRNQSGKSERNRGWVPQSAPGLLQPLKMAVRANQGRAQAEGR